jgi:hypothetical protein
MRRERSVAWFSDARVSWSRDAFSFSRESRFAFALERGGVARDG